MPPKKGQRQARGLARQDQILDVAFELFATEGVRATTIARVAERSGLSEAGLLHHFPSKDALLLAVLDRADASFPDTEAWIAEPGGGLESLRRMPASAQVLSDRPSLARLRVIVSAEAVVQDGAARRYVTERTATIRRVLTNSLAEGVRRGEFRSDLDPASRATEIVAFMEGIQIEWMLDPDAVDLVAAYEAYVDTLVEQLAPPRQRR
jgi:AcrR family transcriptional regulator